MAKEFAFTDDDLDEVILQVIFVFFSVVLCCVVLCSYFP